MWTKKVLMNHMLTAALAVLVAGCGSSNSSIEGESSSSTEAANGIRIQQAATSPQPLIYEEFDSDWGGNFSPDGIWRIAGVWTGTGGNVLDPELADISNGVLSLTVKANELRGSEIQSLDSYSYGYYEVNMKVSSVPGICDSFFWIEAPGYGSREWDVEFLTNESWIGSENRGAVHFTIHPSGKTAIVDLPFNPSKAFHRYGFLWSPGRLDFTVDGQIMHSFTDSWANTSAKGFIMMNAWTGNPNWGGGPPLADATTQYEWVRFFPDATSVVTEAPGEPTDPPPTESSPQVSLTANPSSIVAGESSTLSWNSQNADSCTGSGFATGGSTSGSVAVSPTSTTSYSISCAGAGGSISSSVSVSVEPVSAPTIQTALGERVPKRPIDQDTASIELGVKFQSSVDGQIRGVRFYRGTGASSPFQVSLWTANGQLLATATGGDGSVPGYISVPFPTPVNINANTTYVASYLAPEGKYAGDMKDLDSSISNGDLTLLSGRSSGGNGVFRYGNGGVMPSKNFKNSNYYVDVMFVSGEAAPTDPPPTPSEPQVSLTANPASITAGESSTLQWSSQNADSCTGSGFATGGSTSGSVVVSPTSTRSYSISCAGTGGSISASVSVSVGSVSAPTTQTALGDRVPNTPVDADTASVELGVKFQSSVDGQIQGIRFYRGAGSSSPFQVSLWTASGQLLATTSGGSGSIPGYVSVQFPTAVNIQANTTYVASYLAPNGGYAGDNNGLYSAISSGDLTLLAGSSNGGNGVYNYGSGGVMPSQSYQNSNYFVDVIFASGQSTPTDPPPTPSEPQVSLTASPASIVAGESSTLQWTSQNADSCTGSGFATGGSSSGSVVVSPTSSQNYSISCSGAGGSASASVTLAVGTTTSGELSLARIPWEGGPSVYNKSSATRGTEWESADFFPIGYWGAYVNEERRIANDANLGINAFWGTYNRTSQSSEWMRKYGIYDFSGTQGGSEAVGKSFEDETDMWAGAGWDPWTGNTGFVYNVCLPDDPRHCGYTVMNEIYSGWSDDGKLTYFNVGKGALMWQGDYERRVWLNGNQGPDARANWAPIDIVSGDLYFYTDANVGVEAVNFFGIPSGQVRRAINYGSVLMPRLQKASATDNNGSPRAPMGVVVELGGQAKGRVMTPDHVEGAVWATLIHEARAIFYFSHSFSETAENPWSSDVLNDPSAAYSTTQLRVKKVNSEVKSLARVLNSQSYVWEFNTNLDTMLKAHNGSMYIFAMQSRQSAVSGTYTFTLPPDAPTSGVVEVIGEGRTINYSNRQFSDSFAAEYTHHKYRIAL